MQQLEAVLDGIVGRIQLGRTRVRVNGVGDLIVARLVEAAQVVPNLPDVGVEADGTRVGIQGVTVLVDLEVENTNRAPESGVSAITVHCLLIGLVCLVVPRASHERTSQEVPALCIGTI